MITPQSNTRLSFTNSSSTNFVTASDSTDYSLSTVEKGNDSAGFLFKYYISNGLFRSFSK